MWTDPRVEDDIRRWKYTNFQIYFGVIEYVRSKLCPIRLRKRNGKIMESVNFIVATELNPSIPDEKWRRDLKAIEAKMDFEALLAKLERRCQCAGRRKAAADSPELRLIDACGSINETCRQLNINRNTFHLRVKKSRVV